MIGEIVAMFIVGIVVGTATGFLMHIMHINKWGTEHDA